MTRIGFRVSEVMRDGGGGGGRVPAWLKTAPESAQELKGVFNDASSSIDDVASTVGSQTESALPSVYEGVTASVATSYGSELTHSLGFLGDEFGVAETRLNEYSTAIRDAKDRAVDLDSQISTAIVDYADALSDKNGLPDDADDSEVQSATDVIDNRKAELDRLRVRLADVLEEAYGLDRSYAAQIDAVSSEIEGTSSRLGEISGSIRNGTSVTVALTSLKTEIDEDAEGMPLSDEELAEQHASDLQEAMENEDWDEVERILAEMEVHNDNPEYAEGFTKELGAVGAALLLEAAQELDDQETIRVIDVVNDTLMNGLAEYDTDEIIEWVDKFADEDGEDLDVLPLLLATNEGDGRVHAYSSKYFDHLDHWPTIDYDLIRELVPGFDVDEKGFEEFLASAIDPQALVNVLNEVDEVDAEYIFMVLFPGVNHGPIEERQQLLIELLDELADPGTLGYYDPTDDSAATLKQLLDWLKRWEDDVDYHLEAIRVFLNDPENLYYLVEVAKYSPEWAEISARLIEQYEDAGGEPGELVISLLDHLGEGAFDPARAGENIGFLIALIEQASVDFDHTKIILSIIDVAAARHPAASAVWGVFKSILSANEEYQASWDDFMADAGENADFREIAFFLLLADAGTMRDRNGDPITDELEEFLAEHGLDEETLESDPSAAEETLETIAANPEKLQELINVIGSEIDTTGDDELDTVRFPGLDDALNEIEERIHKGNDPGDDS